MTKEKDKAYSRKTYLKRKAAQGVITHVLREDGKTLCGRYLKWDTKVAEIFTCGSCETYLKKRRANGL